MFQIDCFRALEFPKWNKLFPAIRLTVAIAQHSILRSTNQFTFFYYSFDQNKLNKITLLRQVHKVPLFHY